MVAEPLLRRGSASVRDVTLPELDQRPMLTFVPRMMCRQSAAAWLATLRVVNPGGR